MPTSLNLSLQGGDWPEGPPIRTLDYGALSSGDKVQAELEKTVGDLQLWLKSLEAGLTSMLGGVHS